MPDAVDLQRFVTAQQSVYDQVLAELHAGQKRTHWMWFIFPQLAGLGFSLTARKYAISGRDEAAAYLQHELLGARLRECTQLVLAIEGRNARQIFGYPDDLKFRSCMTLFAAVANDSQPFDSALQKFYAGQVDQKTLDLLG
ncbi:MAG: DUF1810 domain-containing protein [Chromatiales bacterium]|jgi:uncharacterized protein (DUF1810 family)